MMIVKKKLCNHCNTQQVIWKNHEGKRYCGRCWSALSVSTSPKPTVRQKKLPSRSPKRKLDDVTYLKQRKVFLSSHPTCQANLPGMCSREATDIHHTFWGADRSKYFLDITTWKSVCRNCHGYIHDKLSSEEAIQLELKNYKQTTDGKRN